MASPLFTYVLPLMARIEISSKRHVNPDKRNTDGQKLTCNKEEAKSLNAYLKTLEGQVYDVHQEMVEKKLQVTTSNLKDWLLEGDSSSIKMLVPIFEEHNKNIAALIGKEYARSTLERYETSLKHTKAFLLRKYKTTDIDISGINHEFIMAYDFYLRSERSCNNNSTVKYLKNFKKVILICMANGWSHR